MGHFAVLDDRYLHRDDVLLPDRVDEQVGVGGLLARKHLLDDVAVVARRQARRILRDGGEHLPSPAVGHQQHAIPAILLEKSERYRAEGVVIAGAQRRRQREYLQSPGHPLHLGVEHEEDRPYGREHALGRVLAVLFVIVEDDAAREHDQRERGSRHQKGEAHSQGQF